MQNQNRLVFLFNSTPYSVNIDFTVLGSINNAISTSLFLHHTYEVESNVNMEVFQSFINYLFHVNAEVPNITPQNIDQYFLLNQEFQSEAIRNLIESQRGTFDELTVNLTNLKNPLIRDKTLIEQSIARNLDKYVTERGEELISAPINSLVLILSHKSLVFTQYDRLYELIVSEYQRSNNLSIFALLLTFKLSQLSPENQRDSIEQEHARAGMIPKPDILSMINKIDEQKHEINRMKENYKKISLIFIRNQYPNLNNIDRNNESRILDACERGDTDTISQFLNDEIEEGLFKYRLNFSDFTAKIIPIHREIRQEDLIIPKSIFYKNAEFIITSLDERAIEYSDIGNIIFPEDSQVCFIHEEAFIAYFNTIKLPPLLEKFYYRPLSFENILLWPNSRYITKINNQLLLEKSDINSDVFDVLAYANLNIQTITIPDSITKISKDAFDECHKLREVNFSENSRLQTIESKAFSHTEIETITIPSHVTEIYEYAFKDCYRLKTVNFAPNSAICIFRRNMFCGCSIESFIIPCNVNYLQLGWQNGIKTDSSNISVSPENHNLLFLNNKIILGKTDQDNDNDSYDVVLFACSDTEEENIPDYIKQIGPYAFSECKKLRTIHFSENSQLSTIHENAFYQSSLQTITIPSHVQQISSYAFSKCTNLTINFAPNSELRSFDAKIFSGSSIQSLFIPRNIAGDIQLMYKEICSIDHILISTENHNFLALNEKFVLGKTNPNSHNFDTILFASSNCEVEDIPDYIKKIGSYAFSKCHRLRKVNFTENSQLSIIDSYAFFESSLSEITIPRNVTEVRERAFSRCRSLHSFQFSPNSNLRIIGKSAFLSSSITSISIPSSVTQIQSNAFSDCGLRTIIFPENSQLQGVGDNLFYSTTIQNAVIPPHLARIIRINQ